MSLADAFQKIGIGKLRIVNRGIYRLKDSVVRFPDSDASGKRTLHLFRTMLVLSADGICNSYSFACVIAAPMSHSITPCAATDLVVDPDRQNCLNGPGRVILSYMQPILKSDFDKQIGVLSDGDWERIMERVVWSFYHKC